MKLQRKTGKLWFKTLKWFCDSTIIKELLLDVEHRRLNNFCSSFKIRIGEICGSCCCCGTLHLKQVRKKGPTWSSDIFLSNTLYNSVGKSYFTLIERRNFLTLLRIFWDDSVIFSLPREPIPKVRKEAAGWILAEFQRKLCFKTSITTSLLELGLANWKSYQSIFGKLYRKKLQSLRGIPLNPAFSVNSNFHGGQVVCSPRTPGESWILNLLRLSILGLNFQNLYLPFPTESANPDSKRPIKFLLLRLPVTYYSLRKYLPIFAPALSVMGGPFCVGDTKLHLQSHLAHIRKTQINISTVPYKYTIHFSTVREMRDAI